MSLPEMNPNLAYLRADISRSLGFGHVSRAMAMAGALERSGIRSVIFCRELDGDNGCIGEKLSKHQGLIKRIYSEDEFLSFLERKEARFLFIDLREIPDYRALVPHLKVFFPSYRTICFDNFFDDELKFDLFVRPFFDKSAVAKNALVGLKYYVFPEDLRVLALKKECSKKVCRALVTLGGSDPFNATPIIVRALCEVFPELSFTVVVGPCFASDERKELMELARQYQNVECALEPDHLGHHYMATDFAITSGGLTKFETALFGIPSLVLANSLQEEELSKEFADLGSSCFLGKADRLDLAHLTKVFSHLIMQGDRLGEMSRKGRGILDAHGGERVIEYIKQNLS